MSAEKTIITVQVHVAAPIEKVWEYWTNPEHITHWNFASDDWECPGGTNDLRVGGAFTSRMQAKDGSSGFDFSGIYTEIVPQERIFYVMSGEDERKVDVTFTDVGDGILVTESFETETENPPEMQQAGWQAILDNFKKHVENA